MCSHSDKGLDLKKISRLNSEGKVKEKERKRKGFAEIKSHPIFVLRFQKSSLEDDVLEEKECDYFFRIFG